jgi:hypothetical protein
MLMQSTYNNENETLTLIYSEIFSETEAKAKNKGVKQ